MLISTGMLDESMVPLPDPEYQVLIDEHDKDKDGALDLHEFTSMILNTEQVRAGSSSSSLRLLMSAVFLVCMFVGWCCKVKLAATGCSSGAVVRHLPLCCLLACCRVLWCMGYAWCVRLSIAGEPPHLLPLCAAT